MQNMEKAIGSDKITIKEKTYNRILRVCLAGVLVAFIGMMLCQIDGGRGIPYLKSDKDVAVLEQNKEIPWIMYCGLDAKLKLDYLTTSTMNEVYLVGVLPREFLYE